MIWRTKSSWEGHKQQSWSYHDSHVQLSPTKVWKCFHVFCLTAHDKLFLILLQPQQVWEVSAETNRQTLCVCTHKHDHSCEIARLSTFTDTVRCFSWGFVVCWNRLSRGRASRPEVPQHPPPERATSVNKAKPYKQYLCTKTETNTTEGATGCEASLWSLICKLLWSLIKAHESHSQRVEDWLQSQHCEMVTDASTSTCLQRKISVFQAFL